AAPFSLTTRDADPAAAHAAPSEAGEQIHRLVPPAPRSVFAVDRAAGDLFQVRSDPPQPRVCPLPMVLVDDAERLDMLAHPFRAGFRRLLLVTPLIALPRAVPRDRAAVQLTMQNVVDGGRCPTRRPPLLRPRRRRMLRVQQFRDPRVAGSCRAQIEDAPDYRRFRVVDHT